MRPSRIVVLCSVPPISSPEAVHKENTRTTIAVLHPVSSISSTEIPLKLFSFPMIVFDFHILHLYATKLCIVSARSSLGEMDAIVEKLVDDVAIIQGVISNAVVPSVVLREVGKLGNRSGSRVCTRDVETCNEGSDSNIALIFWVL